MTDASTFLEVEELTAFYEKHRDEVWRYLRSLTRSPEEADDLLHTVFLKFISLVEAGRVRRAQARSLIFTMAHKKFLDEYRRKRREARAMADLERTAPVSAPGGFDPGVVETILEALEQPEIPERTRRIVEMRILGQLSVAEICATLELSKSAVYESLEKSMQYLRKVLVDAGFGPDR